MMTRAILFLLLLVATSVQAQMDLTMPSLRRLHQSTYINPAFIPEYDVSIGIPLISNVLVSNSVVGLNVSTITSSVKDSGILDLDAVYSKLADMNGVRATAATDLFHVRFKIKGFAIGISSTYKMTGNAYFSKDFFGLLTRGNLDSKGKTVSIGGTDISMLTYAETGISVAKEIGRWNVGARVKYLNGFTQFSTDELKMEFTTGVNSFDPANLKIHGSMNTNGLVGLFDTINGQRNADTVFSISDITSFNNTGFGFDAGASFWVTPRLLTHASLIDIGAITWKSKVYNYNLDNVDITYSGFTTQEQISDSVAQARFIDSLQALVKPSVTRNEYTTWLPARFIIGADYDLSLRDRVGILLQTQYYRGKYTPAFTLSYTRQVGTNWNIATNYSIFNGSYANIGLGTVIKWGALQLFLIQDDIMIYFQPASSRNIYLRFGFNLVWERALNPHPRTRGF